MNLSSATETDGAAEAFLIPTPTNGDISLYFHIPFCTKKCDYCHFFVLPNRPEIHEEFVSTLLLEWDQKKPLIKEKAITSIYFGGGTPALLSPILIQKILERIPCPKTAEITLEANPENMELSRLVDFREAGINRLSIGAQSFDDELLQLLSRTHDSKKTLQTIEWAEKAGFSNISIDLMYDIPSQTKAVWQRTLQTAVSLPITHLSLYNLTIEPETVFFKKRKQLSPLVPDPDASLWMFEEATRILSEADLKPYEISAFAKQGYHSRHNTGYWMAREFLGLGPSAFSYQNQSRFRNVPHFGKYQKALLNGLDPKEEPDNLTDDERRRELLAVEIRLLQGVDLTTFQNRHGPIDNSLWRDIALLEKQKWVYQKEGRLYLTSQGILFYDSVAVELI